MISLFSNIASLRAQRDLGRSMADAGASFTRLSSGLRINRASDDAAGLAISSGLSVDSRVYGQAIRNANDSISSMNIASGTLGELSNVLIRLRELSSQAANGTLKVSQRRALHAEGYSLVSEYNRLVSTTRFNGLSLFSPGDSTVSTQLGYGSRSSIALNIGQNLRQNVNTGQFTDSYSSIGGAEFFNPVLVDFDGDGRNEIVTGTSYGGFEFWEVDSSGVLQSLGNDLTTLGGSVTDMQVADFNNDGRSDIIAVTDSGEYLVYGNTGSGFSQDDYGSFASGITTVEVIDANGDGRSDVLFGLTNGDVRLHLGQGNNTLSSGTVVTTLGAGASDIAVGDLNGDGIADFAVVNAVKTSVYRGNGFGGFTVESVGTYAAANAVASGDFNMDGIDDLVLGSGSGFSIYSFSESGVGTLTNSVGGTAINDLVVADLNSDGFLDLASNDSQFAGSGNGAFAKIGNFAAGGDDLAVGDVDADGVVDIVSGKNSGVLRFNKGVSQSSARMQYVNLSSRSGALAAMSVVDAALERVNKETGNLGSGLSRLGSALNTLAATRENYNASYSRIADVDVAEESSRLVRAQILQQSGLSILGQANIQAPLALLLLGVSSDK